MNNFKTKKSLGQNFLQDEVVLGNIVSTVRLQSDDLVIEIGPGIGALTKYLRATGAYVLGFEIDERTKPYLDKYVDNRTKIIYQNFMEVNLADFVRNYHYNKLYIIANIPYYITTPIIKKIICSGLDITNIVLMVQDEVANRFTAKPSTREYGSITLYLNYYFATEKLFAVPRVCFVPVPKVNSAVIKLTPRNIDYGVNSDKLFQIINASFKQKRKTIKNNLKSYDLNIIAEVLTNNGYQLSDRAEDLPLEVYIEICKRLYNHD